MPKTTVRATFEMTDPSIQEDGEPSTTSNSIFANISRLETSKEKYDPFITLEHNINILDGSLEIFDLSNSDLAYFSKTLSSDNLETNNEIEVSFSNFYTLYGLTLDFGVKSFLGEIEIKYYKNNELLKTYNVSPTSAEYISPTSAEDFNKIILKFNTTKFPRMFSRLQYMGYGAMFNWGVDDIIACNVVENISPISKEAKPNTCELKVYSEEDTFNMLNLNGPFKYLRKNQKFKIFATYEETEYEFGTFFLDTWDTTTPNVAQFNLISSLGVLSNITYYDGWFCLNPTEGRDGDTVSSALKKILDKLPATIDYNISSNLTTPLFGYIPLKSYKDVVQIISFIACACIYDNRNGYFEVKRILEGNSTKNINLNQVFDRIKISKNELPTNLELTYYVADLDSAESELNGDDAKYKTLFQGHFNQNETKRLYSQEAMVKVRYKKIMSAEGWGELINYGTYYIDFTADSEGDYIIQYTTYVYDKYKRVYDINDSNNTIENLIKVENNHLIFHGIENNGNDIEFIENIKKYYNSVPFKIEFEFINDGTVETGDIVTIETEHNQKLKGYIIEQNIDLSGGMLSKAQLIGEVIDEP